MFSGAIMALIGFTACLLTPNYHFFDDLGRKTAQGDWEIEKAERRFFFGIHHPTKMLAIPIFKNIRIYDTTYDNEESRFFTSFKNAIKLEREIHGRVFMAFQPYISFDLNNFCSTVSKMPKCREGNLGNGGRSLAMIGYRHIHNVLSRIKADLFNHNRSGTEIGTQFAFCGVASNQIGMECQSERNKNTYQAAQPNKSTDPCPPRAIGRRICGLPLGAQIGITAIIAGLAWLSFLIGALRPFGLLVISRRDIAKATGYGTLSLCLFALSFWIGMIGSG